MVRLANPAGLPHPRDPMVEENGRPEHSWYNSFTLLLNRLDRAERGLGAIETRLADVETRLTAIETSLAAVGTSLTAVETRLEALEAHHP